jgi:hypothetical protein
MNKISIEKAPKTSNEITAGSLWQHKDGDVCMLAQVALGSYALIDLADGNSYFEFVDTPKGAFMGLEREFTQITSGTITITPQP